MSGSELKAGARKLIKENSPKIFIISLVFIVITSLMSELEFRMPGSIATYDLFVERLATGELPGLNMLITEFRPLGAALAFILFMIMPIIEIGYMSYCLKITRGLTGDFKDILNGFSFFLKAFVLTLLTRLFILLWSLLLIVPGIVASYRYRQAFYIFLDSPEKSALQCIRESKQFMNGNKLDLFLLDISFIGWYILDVIVIMMIPTPFALPIISIWLTPYTGLACASFYDRLVGRLVC